MATAKIYKKLPGRSLGLAGPTRLWLGPDHLLQVASTLVSERYRRYYFRDIEGFIIQRTRLRLLLNVIFGSLAGICALLIVAFLRIGATMAGVAGAAEGEVVMQVFAWMFGLAGGVCLLLLLWNSLLGATCACFVRTPAGYDRLDAPVRARHARKLLQQLDPLISGAQTAPAETFQAEP